MAILLAIVGRSVLLGGGLVGDGELVSAQGEGKEIGNSPSLTNG